MRFFAVLALATFLTASAAYAAQPDVVHVHCLDANSIDVFFDETLDQTTAEMVSNYTINAGVGDIHPTDALLDTSDATLVHLSGIFGINEGDLTTLIATGILDEFQFGPASDSTVQFHAGVLTIQDSRTDADSTYVPDILENSPDAFFTVQGIVTDAWNFNDALMFLQDDTGGLMAITEQQILRGDEILISGTPYQIGGAFHVTLPSRTIVLSQGNEVQPTLLTLAELSADPETYESMLVRINGVTNNLTGDSWPASDNEAEIHITDDGGNTVYSMRIDVDTDIDGSPEPVWPVDIVGIAYQNTSNTPPDDGYMITPRNLNDIIICVDNDSDGHCSDVDCNDDDILVYPGANEMCDQVDNDCDDETDEEFPDLGQPCDSTDDPDLCANGLFECNPQQNDVVCTGDVPSPELCNGVDDDCDTEADEDWPELGTKCDGPDEDTCENGEYVCSTDMAGITCNESGVPGQEICNGYDDDCDGQTDEDLGTYTCGFGVCMVTVDTCVGGQPQGCDPDPAPEEHETLCEDGLDNDCDALVDDDDVDCRGGGGGDSCGCGSTTDTSFPLLAMFLMVLGLGIRRTR
jgi:hypothetical protein